MTEKENAWKVINRTGDAEWIPNAGKIFDIIVPSDVIRERPPIWEGSGYDWFRCYWHFDQETMGYSPVPGKEPVKDICKWKDYLVFPDLDAVDWKNAVKPTVERLNREEKISMFLWESGPWERLHALLGFQEALEALYLEPEAILELMEAITDYKVAAIDRIAEYYRPDIVCSMDDFGHQNGMFMSIDMFREFILPSEQRIGEALKKHGIKYAHHSCGKIDTMMEDIIDTGMQMLVGLWAPYNDIQEVEEKYSDRFVVIGAMNNQLLADPNASEEDLRAEVRRCVDSCAPYNNFIFDTGMMMYERNSNIVQEEFASYSKIYSKGY